MVPPRRQTERPGHAPASVDARAIAPPEPREDDATNADGCGFRDSFKYTEGASFKVGDCVMVQLEGEGVREGESLRHAAAQILQIWWPAPEEDEDEDEPWAEVRWLYCAEEIVPAKRRPTPAAKYADKFLKRRMSTRCRRRRSWGALRFYRMMLTCNGGRRRTGRL